MHQTERYNKGRHHLAPLIDAPSDFLLASSNAPGASSPVSVVRNRSNCISTITNPAQPRKLIKKQLKQMKKFQAISSTYGRPAGATTLTSYSTNVSQAAQKAHDSGDKCFEKERPSIPKQATKDSRALTKEAPANISTHDKKVSLLDTGRSQASRGRDLKAFRGEGGKSMFRSGGRPST